ncbi:MAG: glycosyltransferase [Rubrivivax sp.]
MRVLIAALGSHGDLLPFIGIAQVLRDRGHAVRIYSNGHYADLVRGAGLTFVQTSEARLLRDAFADPRAVQTRAGMQLIAEGIAGSLLPTYQAMAQDVVAGHTLLVGSTLAFAAQLLAETQGLPFAVVHLSPSVFRSLHDTPRLDAGTTLQHLPHWLKRAAFAAADRWFLDPLLAAPLNAIRVPMGLPPVRRVMHGWIHEADLTVGLFPRWFAALQPDGPPDVLLAGFPLHDGGDEPMPELEPGSALQAFFDEGPAPVVFTAGTANTQSQAFYAVSAAACAQLGLRAVLVAGRRDQLPAQLPPGVIHVQFAPFSWMFSRAALVVHHGGIGTLSQALAAGVPQLIRPMAYDQFDNAQRACRLGVARELLPADYRLPALTHRLSAMLGDAAVRDRCAALAARLAQGDALATVSDALEACFAASAVRHGRVQPASTGQRVEGR